MITQQKTTPLPELVAILLARLGFLWLLVFISLLLPNDDAAFYAFMGVAFIITIPYSLWLRNKLRASQFAPLQFIVDLILVTGLVYFTGGIQSDLTLLYPLVILSSGIVGTPKQAAEITLLAIIIYTLMATLLSNRMLIEYLPEETTLHTHVSGLAMFLRAILFVFFGAASVYVAKRCSYIQKHQSDLTETADSLLHNIPVPALLLDRDGHILFANQPACSALNADLEHLSGTTFLELCAENNEPIPEKYEKSAYLGYRNEVPFPTSYSSQDFRILKSALNIPNPRTNEEIDVTLLTFTDISLALKTDRQLKQMERITSATEIAGEMAKEIRTPLTSISASIQLLRLYEDKATSADWLPNSPRRKDRKELFDHIENASQRMDDVVKNFVDFAEFSPADLLSIIKLDSTEENQGYIDHLNTLGRGLKHGQNTDSGRRSDDSQLTQ
ncbi:MAG: histidine kinase dimerization/phospho-acceptor domain-containing protein [Pontiella sp.]